MWLFLTLFFITSEISPGPNRPSSIPRWYETLRGSRNSNVQARVQERYKYTVETTLKHFMNELPEHVEHPDEESEDVSHNDDPLEQSEAPPNKPVAQVDPPISVPGYLIQVHAPLQDPPGISVSTDPPVSDQSVTNGKTDPQHDSLHGTSPS